MDNVTARINQVTVLLPNPALMSSSGIAIKRAVAMLKPVIVNDRVVQFVNTIRQQDMRTELLKTWWEKIDAGTPIGDIQNRTYLTSISFLLSSPGIPYPDMMTMFDEVERVFNEITDETLKAEAADIMHRFHPERGNRLINELRLVTDTLNINHHQIHQGTEYIRMIPVQQHAARMQELRRFVRDNIVYDDSQNVHNTTINESVVAAARAMIEDTVATVTFDGRYKFNVFKDDTVNSITYRLADILKKFPKDLTIIGDNDQQKLQPRMTYKLAKDAKSTVEVSRFVPDEVDKYMDVLALEDYIFPKNIVREGAIGRRLEEIFIVTNSHLIKVSENKVDEELMVYLDICGIADAEMIWLEREDILKDLYIVIGNERQQNEDINNFLQEVFDDLFPNNNNMASLIKRIKTGTVRDIKIIELLNAVWKFIHTKQGETYAELKRILKQEIKEGNEVCTSGLCAHLVSSIQGYFDPDEKPSWRIKMSVKDELKAKLTHNINRLTIEKEVDPLMNRGAFRKVIDEYVDMSVTEILAGFTDEDIKMNQISKKMITDVAYEAYGIGSYYNDDSDDDSDIDDNDSDDDDSDDNDDNDDDSDSDSDSDDNDE